MKMCSASCRHFDRALLPPPQSFYQRELGKLSRPSRGWARSRCPFHNGNNPWAFSVNLGMGGFHCFNCGVKGGDVLSFLQLRYNLDFKTAAKQLGAWRENLTGDEFRQIHAEVLKREQERERHIRLEHDQRVRRFALRDEIYADGRLISEISRLLHETPEDQSLWRCLELAWQSRELSEREYMDGLEDSDEF